MNLPVNCGATVPNVSFENFKSSIIGDLYFSRVGSTFSLITSDAAYILSNKHQIFE